MKYLYKQTGIIVESDIVLDSTMFQLITESKSPKLTEEKMGSPIRKTSRKKPISAKKQVK